MLVFGTTGTETRFLSESELPPNARLNINQNHTDDDRQLAEALARSEENAGAVIFINLFFHLVVLDIVW